ncbi:IgG-binding virulence factor TspB family protein [Comamonas aquatica]|uniref:IgG-binding virulence factor TspB family protein n=1 Tax=Comamonas aquatica TaxID=225991 RepID=UPI0021B12A1A|nr:IgG-binding virulence factor TspB family protein [Comamonas aquatica]
MPADVPRHIPAPLPVELPEYQPMFIPTGNPVPNPSYNPSQPVSPSNQPFVQPGVKVEPAPSPSAPWQVDVKPVNRPTESPTGSTAPTTDPSTTETPREDGKEDRDFCDKNPESLACTELDTPEGEIPKSTFDVSYSIENSWGSGSCPADKYATLAGKSVKVYDWAQTCDYVATYVRPILLVLCALGALFIVMPGRAEA